MADYASSLSDLINPSEQYNKFESHNADINSNRLMDAIREQEAKKEQNFNRQTEHDWQAKRSYAEGMNKFQKMVPAEGYTDQPDAATSPGTSLSSRVQDPNS